jgi:hypothetical protein
LAGVVVASLGLGVAPTPAEDARKWARCSLAEAERIVTFEVLADTKLISRWSFPVKLSRLDGVIREPPPLPVARWLRAPDPFGKGEVIGIFSDTWLGSVEPEDAVVSFEWYFSEQRSYEQRIAKEIVPVRFGKHESLGLGLLQLKASYLPAHAEATQPK